MGKPLKFLGVLVITLVVLAVALAIALPLLFDINDHKDRIAAAVEAETGRALTIDGDLELTLYPWLGVRSGAMSLAQREGFGDEPFAEFEQASARIRLLPLLLRRDFELGRVGLEGLTLRLAKDADGEDNWSDLLQREAHVEGMPRTDEADRFDAARIEIAGISLVNARVTYRDAAAGTSYVVEELDLDTGTIRIGQLVELGLDARVHSAVPQWRSKIGFRGLVSFEPDTHAVSVRIRRAHAEAEGGVLPVESLVLDLEGELAGDLRARTWALAGMNATARARGGRLPDSESEFRLAGDARVDLASQTARFGPLHLTGMDLDVTLQGEGERILDEPAFTGRVESGAFSPRALLTALEVELPDMRDLSTLTHLEASADFSATATSLHLDGLEARLDASTLRGRAGIADFDRRALRFDLEVDRVDLDRYLPPETPEAEDVAPGRFDAFEIPRDLVARLDLDGRLAVGRVTAAGIRSGEVEARILAADGRARVHPARAQLYGGRYEGDVTLDVTRDTPRLSLDERLEGVQAGLLFKDLFDSERITGVSDLSARLTAEGMTVGQMRRTLDGRVRFEFRDGAVQGFDLWHLIRDARAVLRREERPVKEGPDETRFGSLSGTGTVRQGVMQNDDLVAETPVMHVTGRGSMDLADETLDYRLNATIHRTRGIEDGSDEEELRGLTVPVRISGPFDELNYRVDIESVLKEEVQRRIQDLLIDELRRRRNQ